MKKIAVLNLFVWSMIAFIPGTALSESEAYHLGGVVEVEAGFVNEDDSAMGDSSDIALATVEIGLDAKINKNVEAQIVLLYEDGEDFTVDEGTITLTGPYGEFVTAGKMYVPFGVFNSHFISDPLTLELGETNETALMIGYSNDMVDLSVAVFNGDFDDVSIGDTVGADDEIDDFVASITVTPAKGISFGASYISDIADTDAELAADFFDNVSGIYTDVYDDEVAGYSAFISASVGPITIDAEYLAAAEKFDTADIATEEQPSTFNVELAYAISEKAEIALRYEGAEDFEIETQYGIAYSRELYENTSFALEYLAGEYEDGDDERTVVTAQLGIEF